MSENMKNIATGSLTNVIKLAHEAAVLEVESEQFNLVKKKDIWLKMASELESQNYPKTDIYSIIHKLLQDELRVIKKDPNLILNTGHLYDTMKSKGYTKKSSEQKMSDSSLFDEQTIDKVTGSFAKQREEFIKFHQDIIDQARANISLLESDVITEIKDGEPTKVKLDWKDFFESPEVWNKNFKALSDMFYNEKDDWNRMRDSRQSLLPRMRLILVALTSVATNKWVCSRFFAEVKNLTSITPKKLTQYLRDSDSISDFLRGCKEDAWLWNFMDIDCPKCHEAKLKVKNLENGTWKFVCHNWQKHNVSETFFPAEMFVERLKVLALDSTKFATRFLEKKGIKVPDNT